MARADEHDGIDYLECVFSWIFKFSEMLRDINWK